MRTTSNARDGSREAIAMARFMRGMIVVLLIGMLTNIIVAWCCAACSELSTATGTGLVREPPLAMFERQSFGALFDARDLTRYSDHVHSIESGRCVALHRLHLIRAFDASGSLATERVLVVARAGWPQLAFQCGADVSWKVYATPSTSAPVRWRWGFPGPSSKNSKTASVSLAEFARPLPFRPMWPGFVINTLIFASAPFILWMLLNRWRWTKRLRRLRGGRCRSCAYDLRGANHAFCPECGAAITFTHAVIKPEPAAAIQDEVGSRA